MSPSPDVLNWLCASVRKLQTEIKTLHKLWEDGSAPRRVLHLADAVYTNMNAAAQEFHPREQAHDLGNSSTEALDNLEQKVDDVNKALTSLKSSCSQELDLLREDVQQDVAAMAVNIGNDVANQMVGILQDEFHGHPGAGSQSDDRAVKDIGCQVLDSVPDHAVGPWHSLHEMFLPMVPLMEKFLDGKLMGLHSSVMKMIMDELRPVELDYDNNMLSDLNNYALNFVHGKNDLVELAFATSMQTSVVRAIAEDVLNEHFAMVEGRFDDVMQSDSELDDFSCS